MKHSMLLCHPTIGWPFLSFLLSSPCMMELRRLVSSWCPFVVSDEYETHLAPIVSGVRQRVHDRMCEFLRQCSDQQSQKLAVVQERHADASQGVVDLLNKLLIDLRSKQEPSKPFSLTSAEAGPAQISRTTPVLKAGSRDRHREPPTFLRLQSVEQSSFSG